MNKMAVANEIARQIGNGAFRMMGAKNLVGGENYLTFKVGRGARNDYGAVTHVTVTLTPKDLYEVKAVFARGAKVTDRGTVENVYVEELHAVIRNLTGMETRVPVIHGLPA